MAKQPRPEHHKARLLDIGKRLKWVRELENESQSGLARLFKTDQSKWSKYELGQRLPDPFDMISFCERFGVSLDYIYQGRMEQVPQALALRLVAMHPELILGRR